MIDKNLKIYDDVCTGCSACTEACFFPDDNNVLPINLIKKDSNGLAVPRINFDTCVDCKACYRACPTEDKIYNNDITYDKYLDSLGNAYYGYSLDENHRFEAATAGIITEIASYLIDTRQVDGVVSTYQEDATNEIITKIFTKSDEVRQTRGSIYRQVTLLNGIDKKIKEGNHKKLLVIGLPCHILGLKTLQKANKYLRKNVEFITISIFCKQTKTEEFSDFERSLLNAKKNEKINYRGKGWPGFTSLGKSRIKVNNIKLSLMWANYVYSPKYCFTCSDPIGSISDISVGDAWLHKYYDDKIGSSLFLANSEKGNSILKQMKNDKKIFLLDETKDNIIISQNQQAVKFKTENILYRNFIFGNKEVVNEVDIKYKIATLFSIVFNKFYTFLYRSKIIKHIPSLVLKILNKFLGILKVKI